jgi:hypothetical protein
LGIIGVYMTYDNKRATNSIRVNLNKILKWKGYISFITGDFNADYRRGNSFDDALNDCINNNK